MRVWSNTSTANPKTNEWQKLKRIGWHVQGFSNDGIMLSWQKAPNQITVPRDNDWAGDKNKRKSVSAGNTRYGQLVFRIWSKDQAVTAIFSGEAENAMKLQVDAKDASGIIGRQGLGVVKHLDLSCFWLHQTMQSEESMADIGTTIQMRSILPTESGTRLWRSEHIHHHTTAQHDPFLLSKSYKGQTRLCLDHHSLLN